MKEKAVINLDKRNFRNDVYIHDIDSLDEAFFKTVFQQVMHRISLIVDVNQENKKNRNISKRENMCNNIIPFISGRGTGKTSTMVSTVDFLQTGEWKKIIRKDSAGTYNKALMDEQFKFVCINKIEADLLEEKESIFEAVLTSMYSSFQNILERQEYERREYLSRELINLFDEVYHNFHLLDQKKKFNDYSSIQSLHSASLSLNVRNDFTKLVERYTEWMSDDNERMKTYLVVAIDDIDMNIQNAFDFMEQIHRYLMVPNVIVFMALDIVQFNHICQKHYAELCPDKRLLMPEKQNYDYKDNLYWSNYIATITQNYVDKILPAENRIYLPGIRNENREVLLKGYRDCDIKKNNSAEEDEAKEIKWVVLYKIYRRTGIICDGLGKKKHYYEPDTLRKVVSFIHYLRTMQIAFGTNNLSEEDQLECLQNNMDNIYKDIVERMESEKLLSSKQEIFDEIRRQHVSRQTRSACDTLNAYLYHSFLHNLNSAKDFDFDLDLRSVYLEKRTVKNYTFGDYMHTIYRYSHEIEKSLIHMLLALQTANITNMYNNLRLNQALILKNGIPGSEKEMRQKTIEDIQINFRHIFAGSVSGKWFAKMLNNVSDWSDIEFPENGWEEQLQHTVEMKMDEILECVMNQIVYGIHTMCLLFPDEKNIRLEIKVNSDNGEKQLLLERKRSNSNSVLDCWGFVIEAMDYTRHFSRVRKIIKNSAEEISKLEELFGLEISNKEISVQDKLEEKIAFIEKKYEEWSLDGTFALPVYSIDVYYNLLKRLYENKDTNWCRNEVDENFWKDVEIKDSFQDVTKRIIAMYIRVLKRVQFQLRIQDEYYNQKSFARILDLENKFKNCPFVETMISYEENTQEFVIMAGTIGQVLQAHCKVSGKSKTSKSSVGGLLTNILSNKLGSDNE